MEITTHIISLPFFHGLLNEHIQDLLDVAKIRIYKKKSSVYLYGDLADRFFIIMDGWVKLCQATMDGNEVILALFTRGDSFGEAIVVDGAVYPNNAEIVEDAKLIELPAQALKEVAKKNATFSLRLMETMTNHIHRLQLENEHLAVMTTTQRIGCFILQICLGMKHYSGHLTLPYDKNLAAARLGMKSETFSRGLKDLRNIGVSVKKKEVYIENLKTLKDFCCTNCSCCPETCPLVRKEFCALSI